MQTEYNTIQSYRRNITTNYVHCKMLLHEIEHQSAQQDLVRIAEQKYINTERRKATSSASILAIHIGR